MNVFTNVRNSIRKTRSFSSACFSHQRPLGSGNKRASQALMFHACAVISIYAQLLSKVSSGARIAHMARNCAKMFSWLQRSLAENTISVGVLSQSLLM